MTEPAELTVSSDQSVKTLGNTFSMPLLAALLIFEVFAEAFLLPRLHVRFLGADNFARFWDINVIVADFLVLALAISLRARILLLSRFGISRVHLAWLICGFIANSLPVFPGVPRMELERGAGIWVYYILCDVVLTPVVEESIDRGIFQRSLQDRLPRPLSIVCVAAISAFLHQHFWVSFPIQLLLGTVYAYRKNSLSASIACHAGANIANLVFFSKLV